MCKYIHKNITWSHLNNFQHLLMFLILLGAFVLHIFLLFVFDRRRIPQQEASSCSTEESRGVPGQEEIGSQPGECQPRRGTVFECCGLRNSRTLLMPHRRGSFIRGKGSYTLCSMSYTPWVKSSLAYTAWFHRTAHSWMFHWMYLKCFHFISNLYINYVHLCSSWDMQKTIV